jgi:hypothetical protein
MGARQAGQWERGATMESPRGKRLMQTFRKLPKASPTTKNAMANSGSKLS